MGKRSEKRMKMRAKKKADKARAMTAPGWKSRYARRPGGGHWRDATEAEVAAKLTPRVGATDLFRRGVPV